MRENSTDFVLRGSSRQQRRGERYGSPYGSKGQKLIWQQELEGQGIELQVNRIWNAIADKGLFDRVP